ncbi:MAG: hypothetical protein ACJAZ9_000844 [Neolewinella sp.]|jgi:hypothetical protein
MRHFDLVYFESGRGEKRRQHRSVGEAFQRSSGSKDAEQDGAINFVRVLNLASFNIPCTCVRAHIQILAFRD